MKKCSKCQNIKSLDEFNKASWCKHGVRPECKPCQNKISGFNQKKRRKTNPETFRNTALKFKYNITLEEYTVALRSQGNACKICGSFNPGASKKYFSIDHCHKTGKIRGILCHGCNAGIGMFKEDVQSLKSAIRYLGGE